MSARTTHPGVFIEELYTAGHPIPGVPTSITAFVGRTATGPLGTDAGGPVAVQSFTEFEQTFGELSSRSAVSLAVRDFFLNGGKSAIIVRLEESGAEAESPCDARLSARTYIDCAIAALDKAEFFNLLCIPPESFDPEAAAAGDGTDIENEVYQALALYCVKRRAMLILDSPVRWTERARCNAFSEIQPTDFGIEGETGRNAAVYFPRLIEADPTNQDKALAVPACGAIAGAFARMDAANGVWKASAGTEAEISGILKLELNLTDEQIGLLNPLGINCLRTLPSGGPVIWGARTLRGADAFSDDYKYVPIRRLTLFLEESIDRGTKWAVYEPNNEVLWRQIQLSVGNFMQSLFRQGALLGSKPEEAYFVRCDATTTTQADIENGRININIGFAPLKPAEFVVIRIQQMALQNKSD